MTPIDSRRFPELKDLRIEWEECLPSEEGSRAVTGALAHSILGAGGKVEPVLACPKPRCRGGGFEVGFLVESMTSERIEERTGVLVCVGWEGNAGGSREASPCTRAIRYRIRLSYARRVGRATRQGENGGGRA